MGFEYTNTKGIKYFLHKKGTLYYFSRQKKDDFIDLPIEYQVIEAESTRLPLLKKNK